MSQLPPLSQTLGYASPVPPPARSDLRTVALHQMFLQYCILAYLLALLAIGLGSLIGSQVPALGALITMGAALLVLAAFVTGIVFVFMLAISLNGVAGGVIMGICMFVPLINLIILLVVSQSATNLLKRHGIKVGLLGANYRQIPAAGVQPAAPGQYLR